jgi:hypothetical protein
MSSGVVGLPASRSRNNKHAGQPSCVQPLCSPRGAWRRTIRTSHCATAGCSARASGRTSSADPWPPPSSPPSRSRPPSRAAGIWLLARRLLVGLTLGLSTFVPNLERWSLAKADHSRSQYFRVFRYGSAFLAARIPLTCAFSRERVPCSTPAGVICECTTRGEARRRRQDLPSEA